MTKTQLFAFAAALEAGLLLPPPAALAQAPRAGVAPYEDPDKLYLLLGSLIRDKRTAEAIPVAERLVVLRERSLGPNHPDTALALLALGSLYRETQNWARAEPCFRRALAAYQRLNGPDSVQVGQVLFNLGILADKSGDDAGALAAYQRTLAIYERNYRPGAPQLTSALNALKGYYYQRKNYQALEPLLFKEVAIESQVHGAQSDQVAETLLQVANVRGERKDHAGAESILQRVLAIAEAAHGPMSREVGATLTRLGLNARSRNDAKKAIAAYERAITIYESPGAFDHKSAGLCLNNLALIHGDAGDHATAEPLFARALAHDEKAGDKQGVALNLVNLGTLQEKKGDFARARSSLERALAAMETLHGPNHPDVARALEGLAGVLEATGDYGKALKLAERALAIREKVGDSGDLVDSLNGIARVYNSKGDFKLAEERYQRALGILERQRDVESKDGAMVLGNLAGTVMSRGDYARARPLYERALAISERVHDRKDPARAHAWNNFGDLLEVTGEYARAQSHYGTALEIWTAAFGPTHPLVATALNNLGTLYRSMGDYARAGDFLQRALDMSRRSLPPGHPDLAIALNNLGALYLDQGAFERAESYYQQALTLFEQTFGPDHARTALAYNNMATLHGMRGDGARAIKLFDRALAIVTREQNFHATARTLISEAAIYDRAEDFARAEPLLRRALALLEANIGPEHPDVALALNQLASLRAAQDDLGEAEPLIRRALAIAEKVEGPNGMSTARYQASLAHVLSVQGRHAAAEPLYERAIRSYRGAFGDNHPQLAEMIVNQAILYWAKGDRARAVAAMTDGLNVRERGVVKSLAAGSESQRLLFHDTSRGDLHWAVALHANGFSDDAAARRLALLAILRRKGRVLDAMSDTTRALRAHLDPEGRAMFERLRALRASMARRTWSAPTPGASPDGDRKALEQLAQAADVAEGALAKHSEPFRIAIDPVTVERVAAAVPRDAALIEIASYLPFDPHAKGSQPGATRGWKPARYAAYVLRSGGEIGYVDLGDGKTIDALVKTLRQALGDPNSDVAPIAHELEQQLIRPIRPLVGGSKHLIIVPDGALSLIPFGALIDEKGRYLAEDVTVSYLSTGRELLRQVAVPARGAPLVLANPNFDAQPAPATAGHATTAELVDATLRAAKPNALRFAPLPGTEKEGRAVATSLRGAVLLTGAAATTAALTGASGPSVLHLATHGFFLDDPPSARGDTRGFKLVPDPLSPTTAPAPFTLPKNPLLRSGLAFAGANRRETADVGLLTALEASSLDLWGTKLVVLSACETGVGKVQTGEGVYGLRRAISLAGAESLIMSLWEVSDWATRDLMVGFYARLARGEGRAQALRSTQLELLRKPATAHPFFWASFVPYGNGAPIGDVLPRAAR